MLLVSLRGSASNADPGSVLFKPVVLGLGPLQEGSPDGESLYTIQA